MNDFVGTVKCISCGETFANEEAYDKHDLFGCPQEPSAIEQAAARTPQENVDIVNAALKRIGTADKQPYWICCGSTNPYMHDRPCPGLMGQCPMHFGTLDQHIARDNPKPSAFDVQAGGDHYKDRKHQPFPFVRGNDVPHAEGECIYKLLRWREKGGIADLKKVIHTVQLIIEYEEGKAP